MNGRIFLYAARKGMASITICGDCGNNVVCLECGSSVVLHTKETGNFFLCHRCGERRSAEEVCKVCGSWKLMPLGIGIEKVKGEFQAGDLVVMRDSKGEYARGLTNFNSVDLKLIAGKHSSEISATLGRADFREAIHRDNLIVTDGAKNTPAKTTTKKSERVV